MIILNDTIHCTYLSLSSSDKSSTVIILFNKYEKYK